MLICSDNSWCSLDYTSSEEQIPVQILRCWIAALFSRSHLLYMTQLNPAGCQWSKAIARHHLQSL